LLHIYAQQKGFGRGDVDIARHADVATVALLLQGYRVLSPPSQFVIVEVARRIGELGLAGEISVLSQPEAARSAIQLAALALRDSPGDDSGDLYRELLGRTRSELASLSDRSSRGIMNPDGWFAWRFCREMVLLEYELLASDIVQRQRETPNPKGSSSLYDMNLEELVAASALGPLVDRLHRDCFLNDRREAP
jgi:hypothetical protein